MTNRQRAAAQRQLQCFHIVNAAAMWMDHKYPYWDTGVRDAVRAARFDIRNPNMCVLGAGTGHLWSSDKEAILERSVARTLGLARVLVHGVVSQEEFEALWIMAAFERAMR